MYLENGLVQCTKVKYQQTFLFFYMFLLIPVLRELTHTENTNAWVNSRSVIWWKWTKI